MIVTVDGEGVRLAEPDALDAFHVSATDGIDVDGELRRSGAGWVAGDGDARVAVDWVRGAAVAAGVGATWPDSFDAMLAVAEEKGWLDDRVDGSATIQAHIIRGAGAE